MKTIQQSENFTRYSRQREAVLNYLKEHKNHPSATEIYDELKKVYPNISLGTIYRNLADLRDRGLILELKAKDAIVNYDGDTSAHSHFVCEKCGKIYDVFDDKDETPKSLNGFNITGVNKVYYGVCPLCIKKI